MTKSALLVGCDYTGTPDALSRGCIDDIQNVYQMLTKVYGYLPQNIVMLRDDDPKNLPTRANIEQRLAALVASSASMEEIWFHYSGHGTQIRVQNAQNTNRTMIEDAIVPIDVISKSGAINIQKLIVGDELHAFASRVAPTCRAIWLFDSCHSGTICEMPYVFNYAGNKLTAQNSANSYTNVSCPQFYMMSGCTDQGTSANIFLQAMNEYVGAFTTIFILTLQLYKYSIDMKTLYEAVCLELSQNGFTQHPWLSCSGMATDFVFQPTFSGTAPVIIPLKLNPVAPAPVILPANALPQKPVTPSVRKSITMVFRNHKYYIPSCSSCSGSVSLSSPIKTATLVTQRPTKARARPWKMW